MILVFIRSNCTFGVATVKLTLDCFPNIEFDISYQTANEHYEFILERAIIQPDSSAILSRKLKNSQSST